MKLNFKFILLLVSVQTLLVQSAIAQNFSWIIPNKNYLKLFVIDDGIYRINRTDFTQAGINTDAIDPRTVKVFYKGLQIPIYFEGEQNGLFDDADYIDFYGTRNYGGLTNTYRSSLDYPEVHYITDEYFNQYSDTSVYWIGWDGANGLRMQISAFSTTELYGQSFSFDKLHFEQDTFYDKGETVRADSDFRYFNNEKISGEGWFWKKFIAPSDTALSITFNLINLFETPQTCSLRIFAFPGSKDSSFNEHKVNIRINGTTITQIARNDYERFDTTITFQSSLLNGSSQNIVTIRYAPTFGNPNAVPVLLYDLCEFTYPRKFLFDSSKVKIVLTGTDTTSKSFRLPGFNIANPVSIYDVKNGIKITNYSVDTDTLTFTGKSNASFEVLNRVITKKPFRIIAKQVPDFISPSNGADYIVIYNRLFQNAAENLRQHRQSLDNYRSFKAAVDDVFDIFNYGMEDPSAIRNFLNHVYNNWTLPKVKYVCLLGRGSLDPKNLLAQPFNKNLIPVYGNPPSDGYLATFNFGGFTYYKQISIGRLPAYNESEANDMVNKIISYDLQRSEPNEWWKKIIMITGGPTRVQQIGFQAQSDIFINSYLYPCPTAANISKIYRNDSTGYVTYNYKDSIKKEFDRGALLVNFIGHAANQDWEIGLEDPNTLANGTKLPLVLSMTCFTGKNAESNARGFGEQFLYLNNKGAIGFVGSTGWSYSGQGNALNDYIFRSFTTDSMRSIGDLLRNAENYLADDSNNFSTRNTINCYDLLGDPATKLLLPTYPEFTARPQDYRLSNPYPTVNDNVTFTIYPKDYGTCATSCAVRFELLRNGFPVQTKDTSISNFRLWDTLRYSFSIDTVANYSLRATLDYGNQHTQEINSNNIYLVPLPIRNVSFVPLKPVNNSALKTDSVEFVGLNPQLSPGTSIKLMLQADTNLLFQNPLHNFSTTNISGVVTRTTFRLPNHDTNKVYYWRTNSIINGDSTGWTAVQKFTYNPVIGNVSRMSLSYDSTVTIYIKKPGQIDSSDISNLSFNGSGYVLKNFAGTLQSHSFGSNSFQASYFIINGFQFNSDGGQNTGLNIAKVSRLTGKPILPIKNFRMSSPQSSDSVLNFLNTFDTTHFIMSYIAMVGGGDTLNLNTKNKFREFGSTMIDSVKHFNTFDSWAFIGFLGANSSQISEEFQSYPTQGCPDSWCPSNAILSPTFLNTNGSLTFKIGPAHRWKYFSWERILPSFSSVSFDVYGINRQEQQNIILSNVSSNNFVALDTIDYFNSPSLKLVAKLSIDTVNGLLSPVFNSVNFKYTPPAELVPDNNSIYRSDSVVQEGQQVTFSVKNYNVGYVTANAIINKWTAIGSNGVFVLKTDTIYTPLKQDSMQVSSVTFSTSGMHDPNKYRDSLLIFFETQHPGNTNDYFLYNNFTVSNLVILGDSTGPSIDVTFDGQKIINGDFVRKNPDIVYKFYDLSDVDYTLSDTTNVRLKLGLNNETPRDIYFKLNGAPNPEITFTPVNEGSHKVTINYKPTLPEGGHTFRFIGIDKSSNRDTLPLAVQVNYALKISQLYNFPNPFRDNTSFTFILSGEVLPTACRIKIYSVAGRLIKEISAPAFIGWNVIEWDGRDNDGEQMANGIYLYKIILEDGRNTESSIQKAALLR